jgi:glycosyltransferase 2 family protein
MEDKDKLKAETKTSKLTKLLLKIVITAACLWYVSGKIDFTKAWAVLKTANWIYLFLALLVFILSKLISAIRLNIYFKNAGLYLSLSQNIKLYLLGMFYNLFLPGSISGDAYKILLLKKKYTVTYKKTTAAILLDRFSGLLGLGLILAVYSIIVINKALYIVGICCGAVLAVLVVYFIVNRWLKDYASSFFPTLLLGILVQVSQVICAYLIMASLGIPIHVTEYIFIFLVSSIVSVLPLTIGGLGIREVVFLEGSKQFGLLQETSVVISLLFYLITLVTSAGGLFYVFNPPLAEKKIKDPLLSP